MDEQTLLRDMMISTVPGIKGVQFQKTHKNKKYMILICLNIKTAYENGYHIIIQYGLIYTILTRIFCHPNPTCPKTRFYWPYFKDCDINI